MNSSRLRVLLMGYGSPVCCVDSLFQALVNMNRALLFTALIAFNSLVIHAQQKPGDSTPSSAQNAGSKFVPPPSAFGKEDQHSLKLIDSDLREASPISGEKDVYPEFTRELLEVQWRDGDPIDLYIIKPTGVAKPPVVLYLYGYPSETDRFRNNDYCKRLTADGYAAIGFVSALTGQRYHDLPMKEWFVSEMPDALSMSVHDVQMVIRYLSERGDLDTDHVGIFGNGSGATIAVLAASVDSRIKAVDALQPWGDWPTWLAKSSLVPESERPTYLKPEFLARVAPYDPIQWFARVQTKALRIQFVLDDKVTPAVAVQGMRKNIPASIQVLQFATAHQQYEVMRGGRAFDWIKDQLHTPDARPANARADNTEHPAQNERTP